MRINQFLARAGVASRRKADDLVEAGRVRVNGATVIKPGVQVDPAVDLVEVDGRRVAPATKGRLFRYYKPRGVVCSLADERGRPDLSEVARALPPGAVPAGRLDRASEGLLLWSTDGEWVKRLTHPRYGVAKRYRVTIAGRIRADFRTRFEAMRALEDGTPLGSPVRVLSIRRRSEKTDIEIELREGRQRQIRRMLDMIGLEVRRLVRIAEGGVTLDGLAPGVVEEITGRARQAFLTEIGLQSSDNGETPSGGDQASSSA